MGLGMVLKVWCRQSGMAWYAMYDIVCIIGYGEVGTTSMVWYGVVWYGMVWYGMVWYGMVWYGMVLYGMV